MKMSSAPRCQLAGCGENAVTSAPHHDPFAEIVFEQLVAPTMTPTCDEHADVLWNLYRARVALSLVDGITRVSIPEETMLRIAWTLNSHNDATSKSVGALLATLGRGPS
jgi:hypothetical protein